MMKCGWLFALGLALLVVLGSAQEESKPEFVIDAGGHTGAVTDIAYCPDGKSIAWGSNASLPRVLRL